MTDHATVSESRHPLRTAAPARPVHEPTVPIPPNPRFHVFSSPHFSDLSTWRALASVPEGPRAETVRGMRSAAKRASQSAGEGVARSPGWTERGRSLDEPGRRKHRRPQAEERSESRESSERGLSRRQSQFRRRQSHSQHRQRQSHSQHRQRQSHSQHRQRQSQFQQSKQNRRRADSRSDR
jgi:hypothetical protein